MSSFHFKQFVVTQESAAMKVGTDGVLLGAWADVSPEDRLALDVGTGTGVIALMLAQRMKTTLGISLDALPDEKPERGNRWEILGIDIDEAAAGEAAANFAASPWADRLSARADSLQDFVSESGSCGTGLGLGAPTGGTNKPCRESPALSESPREPFTGAFFDLIVTNPPFFKASLKAPDAQRRAARHDDTLSSTDLIAAAARLLSPTGRLAVIYPPEEARAFVLDAEAAGLYLSRQTRVISIAGQAPKRHLMEFSRTPGMPTFDDLVLHDTSGGPRSAAYRALTADFYLD